VGSSKGGKLVVVKEVQTGHMSASDKTAAQKEAKVLSQMRHSNIISYIESFVEGSCLYIAMEHADGGDLSTLLKARAETRDRFTEKKVLSIFTQLLAALRHVHSQHILHRDLKAQNVFLTVAGVVKLGDFGVARVLQATQDCAKTQIGTPFYLAPEIWNGDMYVLIDPCNVHRRCCRALNISFVGTLRILPSCPLTHF
jgi:NIMA (never in mitosis gene a)-related kinase